MITHRASESVGYTVPLSAVNGLSRLTTTSNGQTRPIRKFSNRQITVTDHCRIESNRNGRFKFESNLEASQVPTQMVISCNAFQEMCVMLKVRLNCLPSAAMQSCAIP